MKKLKQEILFEFYAIKAKARKAGDFYNMWKKWCKTFDENYAVLFDKHFND